MQKGTHFGCLFAWSNSGFSRPLPCCGRCMSSPVYRAARRARAVVEHTRKPGELPRPERRGHLRAGTPALPGVSGAVRSANGRVDSPIQSQKPNQKAIWFGFCFALIFNTYTSVGIAGGFAKATPTLALASPATAPTGAKCPQKAKKPTMPTRHGVESRAQALTRSRKPVFLSSNTF